MRQRRRRRGNVMLVGVVGVLGVAGSGRCRGRRKRRPHHPGLVGAAAMRLAGAAAMRLAGAAAMRGAGAAAMRGAGAAAMRGAGAAAMRGAGAAATRGVSGRRGRRPVGTGRPRRGQVLALRPRDRGSIPLAGHVVAGHKVLPGSLVAGRTVRAPAGDVLAHVIILAPSEPMRHHPPLPILGGCYPRQARLWALTNSRLPAKMAGASLSRVAT
jgi:hypothetical protein